MTEHAPTPFFLAEDANPQGTNIYYIYGAEPEDDASEVIGTIYRKENAEEIILRCNAHEGLVEDKQKVLDMMWDIVQLTDVLGGDNEDELKGILHMVFDIAQSAPRNLLAKAEEVGS